MVDYTKLSVQLTPNPNSLSGELGYELSDGFHVIDPDDARKMLVRFANGNHVSAFHYGKVTQKPGRPVLVGFDNIGRPFIIGDDPTKIDSFLSSSNSGAAVGLHDHVRNSGMDFIIDTWLLKQLQVRVASGTTLSIAGGFYLSDTGALTWLEPTAIDIASEITATTGFQNWVVVALDPTDGSISASAGTAIYGSYQMDNALVPDIDVTGLFPLAAVWVNNGQTLLYNYQIEDLRFPLDSSPAASILGIVAAALTEGTNIDIVYDSGAGTITIGITGQIGIGSGGTGAATAANARINLGLEIGVDVEAYNTLLAAIAGLSSNGIVVRTSASTASVRSITAAAPIAITNGDGVAGNPAVALDILSLSEDTTPDGAADHLLSYDASASTYKKVLVENARVMRVSTDNISTPPTQDELNSAFGLVPVGFRGEVWDNGSGNAYFCIYRGAGVWEYVLLTQISAVAYWTYAAAAADLVAYWRGNDAGILDAVVNPVVALGRNIVFNGTFDSSTGWTAVGAGGSITGGKAVYTAVAVNNGYARAAPELTIGKIYEVTFTLSNVTGGDLNVRVGSVGSGTNRSTNGTFVEYIRCAGDGSLRFYASTGAFSGSLDDVLVKQVNLRPSSYYPSLELLADPEFDYTNAAWPTATNWAVSGGKATHTTGSVVALTQTCPIIITRTFDVVVTVSGRTAGSVTPRAGSTGTGGSAISANGVAAVQTLTCAGSTAFALVPTTDFDGSIDSVTLVPNSATWVWNGDGSTLTGWSPGNSATNASTGGRLRTARNGVNNPDLRQASMKLGATYHLTLKMYSDGSSTPRILDTAVVLATGTTSTSQQDVDIRFVATTSTLLLQAQTSTGTEYAEFDDIVLVEVAPMTGADSATGVTLNQSTGNALADPVRLYNGSTGYTNLYSNALNSAMNPAEFTLKLLVKMDTTSTTLQRLLILHADANNRVYFDKTANADEFLVDYVAGGTSSSVTFTLSTAVDFVLTIVVSKAGDYVKVYANGVQQGTTQTGLGTFVGNLSSLTTVLAAASTSAVAPMSGYAGHVTLFNTPHSLGTIITEDQRLGAAA